MWEEGTNPGIRIKTLPILSSSPQTIEEPNLEFEEEIITNTAPYGWSLSPHKL